MVSTDALPLLPMEKRDIAGCMALSAEAGWNQTPEDWTLFLDRGTVFGLSGADGREVATGAILPYGDAFAWVSMVLVTASRRRTRIGTRILETCCTEADTASAGGGARCHTCGRAGLSAAWLRAAICDSRAGKAWAEVVPQRRRAFGR